ncbi:aluminum-activated malate transporter 10-like [Rutidosis leptorrhynchoides]|uniref:aluminum-activated malate transporter 10-like n=1 Tax=Rutidosis leptorrhynchoides TaxID=125765 RepID=UPI003A99E614
MDHENRVEWNIDVGDKSLQILEPKNESILMRLRDKLKALFIRVRRFLKKTWDLGVDDPRRVYHCLKVGLALTLVSFFYYIRPLYDGFGGNAMWALMTVVVVFEYTVGGTLYKCLNRICATFLAGFLALGVNWVAAQSGHRFEPVIMGISLFVIASVTTYSRFIPLVKARYDYGCTIFILTYGLVLVSGYRVENLMDEAMQRLSTIILGTCLCIVISMLVFPVWAGMELHILISSNLNKLANSLDSCVYEYFSDGDEESKNKIEDYRCVLNSKASEESMSDFARWEPAHGEFSFRYPWKIYIKIGSSSRSCAYCIETLISRLDSKNRVPETIRHHVSASCLRLSLSTSDVIRKLSTSVFSMTRSTQMDRAVIEMKNAVQQLQNDVKSLPDLLIRSHTKHELLELIPMVTFISLLIEIASKIGSIIKVVEELAQVAKFRHTEDEREIQNTLAATKIANKEENMKVLQINV